MNVLRWNLNNWQGKLAPNTYTQRNLYEKDNPWILMEKKQLFLVELLE